MFAKGFIWIIVIFALQAIVAALAKRAQANATARQAGVQPGAESGAAAPQTPAVQSVGSSGRPRVLARGQAKRPPSAGAAKAGKPKGAPKGAKNPKPPMPPVAPAAQNRGGDSADALLSRQHLIESVARIKAAESRVADASGIHAKHALASKRAAATISAAEIARSLRNPHEVQRALIMGEILGRPRAMS